MIPRVEGWFRRGQRRMAERKMTLMPQGQTMKIDAERWGGIVSAKLEPMAT